jgi:uncharacterized LabA/DUF88 family protein
MDQGAHVSKNVAVFVDVANIFYAAKAAGVDIDYVTLLKAASAGRDLVRAYAYTGLDPENENQRNFHSFLARHGYRVVSKDIRKYGDGKVKANLDIELVVDMMKTARNLDIAIVVSGDGDFAPAIRAVQEMGVRVEVISFRGNTSSDLIDVADQFSDITALAKVEKGSSRSGRRVADDEEDLSMTEVPDKQTEGAGDRRGRGGRGRGRGRAGEAEPVRTSRGGGRVAVPASAATGGVPLVALPGEKLSKAALAAAAAAAAPVAPGDAGEVDEADVESGGAVAAFAGGGGGEAEGDADGRRRRRRRGGRGRGRGRGRGEGAEAGVEELSGVEDDEVFEAPRAPRTTPFGSVWDSQLGVPSAVTGGVAGSLPPIGDDEDFEEPEIPEYLIAERRNRGQGGRGRGAGGRGGARGGRSAYAAAIERERYGRGGGGGGINRYPDVSGRDRPRERTRDERPPRQPASSGGAPRGGEEWSEVPPELEAMLRAQLGGGGARRPAEERRPASVPGVTPAELDEEIETFRLEPEAETAPAPEPETARPARGRRKATDDAVETAEAAAPKRRTTRRSTAAAAEAPDGEPAEEAAPRRRTARRSSPTAGAESGEAATPVDVTEESPAPKRRTTRRKASADEATAPDASAADEATAETDAPKRRTTRRKATETATGA